MAHTGSFSSPEILTKPRFDWKFSCCSWCLPVVAGTASFFLTAGEDSGQCSVSRTINIAWISGEGKENFVGSAEPLLVPNIIASETTFVFVHGINVTDIVQTHFHIFPARLFFMWLYPLEPLVQFFLHSWLFYHSFLANSIQHRSRYLLQIHHKVSLNPFILPGPL